MKKKSVLSMLLALLLAASATACAKTAAPEPAGSAAGSVSEAVSSASEAASASEASADAPDATRFEALVAANTVSEILSRHSNTEENSSLLYKNEVIGTQMQYAEESMYYMESSLETSMGFGLWCTPDCSVLAEKPDGNSLAYYLSDDPGFYQGMCEETKTYLSLHIGENEELISTEEQDAHFVACTLSPNTEEFFELSGAYYENTDGWENLEQMKVKFRYIFDLASSDVLTIEAYLVDVDGSEELVGKDEMSYDVDFDPAGREGPLSGSFNPGDEVRKIRLTYAAGTDQAHTSEYTLPKHAGFITYTNGDYVEAYYLDEACTQPYEGSDGTQDLELYVK